MEHLDDVARDELSPAARLDLAVDRHGLAREERPGITALINSVRELEELSEPNAVTTDRNNACLGHDHHHARTGGLLRTARHACPVEPARAPTSFGHRVELLGGLVTLGFDRVGVFLDVLV